MRMLVVTYRLPVDLCSGDQLTIHHMLRYFSQRHEIVLVTPGSRRDRMQGTDLVAPYCERVEVIPLPRWQSYWNCLIGLLSSDPLQIHYFRSDRMLRRVKEILEEDEIDVAYAYHLRSGQYLTDRNSCSRALDLKPVQTLNLKRMRDHIASPIKRMLYDLEYQRVKQYESHLVGHFDRCFVISETDRAVIDPDRRLDSILVNPHGLDSTYFTPRSNREEEPASMIFTGYMKYEPNVDAVLFFYQKIFPLIKAHVPNVKLYIVGKAPRPEVAALAKDSSVVVTGFVEDIRPHMNRVQVAIDPLRIGAGLQNKVLEGMSMGLPMVITSIANEGIRAVDEKHLLIADSAESFAQRVVMLLKHPCRRQQLGEAAREFILENWSWEKHFKDLEQMLLRLASEDGRSIRCSR